MKRKLYIIIPIIIIVIALFLAVIAALGLLFFSGNELEVGRIVICEGEDDVFVDKNGQFWVMKETSPLKARPEKLKTGDKILVYRSSAMAMSYPGQCAVKWCCKLEGGGEGDIPQSVLDELKRIGWIK